MENQYYYALGQVSYSSTSKPVITPMTTHNAAIYHAPIYAGNSNNTIGSVMDEEEEFTNQMIPVYNQLDSNQSGHIQTNSNTLLNKNFASKTAVRDFNDTVPVVVLNSNFIPKKGATVYSDPRDRL